MQLSKEDLEFVENYSDAQYWHPSVTADTVLFRVLDKPENATKKYPLRKLEVLLVKRGGSPYKGGWALPGGFCEKDESLHECAARECFEETGLKPVYCGEASTYSSVNRDPRTRVITQSFVAVIPEGEDSTPKAGDDAAEAAWFEVEMRTETISPVHYQVQLVLKSGDLSISGSIALKADAQGVWRREIVEDASLLAFDHLEMICCAVEVLRTKIYRTPIAFKWVKDQFRIADLQSVFEAVIGNELLRTTFFEHVKPLLKRVEDKSKEAESVLDQIYEYNKNYCLQDGLSALDLWQS